MPYYKGVVDAMCLQSPIYDVIIGNIPGGRPPESPEKEWKPEDDVVADGLSQQQTHMQIDMAVTRGQAKRDKQTKRPLKVAPELDLKITGEERQNQQKEDTTFTHVWKMANEKKPASIQKQVCRSIMLEKISFTEHTKIWPKCSEAVASNTERRS